MLKPKEQKVKKPKKGLPNLLLSFLTVLVALILFWLGYKSMLIKKSSIAPAFLSSPNANVAALSTPDSTVSGLTDFNIPSAETDSDQDGLSDAMETLYKTDPNNPDTDGDGYKDGDEVANDYDPLIKSPNDKIVRSSNIKTSSPIPSPPSLTQQFVNKTGITTKENILSNEEQINQFINETNARGVLPIVLDSDIKITNTSGKAAIVKYLDTLSVSKNSKLKAITIEQITAAFKKLAENNEPTELNKIISNLENNAVIFRNVEVPKEATELHKKYLSAVLALLDDTKMLKNYKNDYVSTLVAASRLEGLEPVFTEIEDDIKALEKKYGIK